MKPRSPSNLFIIVLCVIALFAAQTLGGKRGYPCVCGGRPVPTQTSHCHGPHGEKCHAGDAQANDSHSEEGFGQREEHQVLNQDVPLRPVSAVPQVIAPRVLLAILPLLQTFFASQEAKVPASYTA